MDPHVFLLPSFFDYGATFLWAVTGALMGARRGYDFIGIFILAMVSSTGGGLLRDGVFLQDGPPVLVRSPVYLVIVLGGAVLVLLFGGRVEESGIQSLVSRSMRGPLCGRRPPGHDNGSQSAWQHSCRMVSAVGGQSCVRCWWREPHLFKPGTLRRAPGRLLHLYVAGGIRKLNENTAAGHDGSIRDSPAVRAFIESGRPSVCGPESPSRHAIIWLPATSSGEAVMVRSVCLSFATVYLCLCGRSDYRSRQGDR